MPPFNPGRPITQPPQGIIITMETSKNEISNEVKLMNYDTYKEGYENHKKANIKIFQYCLKIIPREIIIEELKKRKIIGYDWREEKFKALNSKDDKNDNRKENKQ